MDILEKRFFVRNSLGESHKFFYEDKKVYMSKGDLERELVIDAVNSDFFVVIDEEDKIHMLCQNLRGDIIYLNYTNSSWAQEILLISKSPEIYNKQFFILPSKDNVDMFFIIKSDGKWLLIHQSKNKFSTDEPYVIDYIRISSKTYSVDKDSENNIYVFYNCLDKGFLQIGYKKFDSGTEKWTGYIQVSSSNSNNSTPSILVDKENNIHAVWIRQKNETMSLIYQKRVSAKLPLKAWGNESIIYSIDGVCCNPLLITIDENLCGIWLSEGNIYTCFSYDNGETWNKAIKYDSSTLDKAYLVHFSSNLNIEKYRIKAKECLGNIDEGIKLAVISELLDLTNEYVQEAASSSEVQYDMGNVDLYLESVKTYSYKIAEKVRTIETEKNALKEELEGFKKINLKLHEESSNLKNTLDFNDMENQKLSLQVTQLNKKFLNLSTFFNEKESELKEKSQKVKELIELNSKLQKEMILIKGELDREKNLPFYRKILRFKWKSI